MTAIMIDEATEHHHDAALARKRRIELRSKNRRNEDEPSEKRVCIRDSSDDEEYLPDDVASSGQQRKKPSIRGIKKHARYDPGVPMTKEELVAWRKEARRVRNRESAAASRKRTRDRIQELEGEVAAIKSKYSAALQRIVELEAANTAVHGTTSLPSLTSFPQDASLVSPCASTTSSPQLDSTPSLSPQDSFTLIDGEERQSNQEMAQKYNQHITEMISRPNA
jgi:hypothetical protein